MKTRVVHLEDYMTPEGVEIFVKEMERLKATVTPSLNTAEDLIPVYDGNDWIGSICFNEELLDRNFPGWRLKLPWRRSIDGDWKQSKE